MNQSLILLFCLLFFQDERTSELNTFPGLQNIRFTLATDSTPVDQEVNCIKVVLNLSQKCFLRMSFEPQSSFKAANIPQDTECLLQLPERICLKTHVLTGSYFGCGCPLLCAHSPAPAGIRLLWGLSSYANTPVVTSSSSHTRAATLGSGSTATAPWLPLPLWYFGTGE